MNKFLRHKKIELPLHETDDSSGDSESETTAKLHYIEPRGTGVNGSI